MATPKQVSFLYENLRLDWNLAQKLTVSEASEIIGAYKAIPSERPDVRHYAVRKLARQVESKFTDSKCGMCGKPVHPVNDLNSCSC